MGLARPTRSAAIGGSQVLVQRRVRGTAVDHSILVMRTRVGRVLGRLAGLMVVGVLVLTSSGCGSSSGSTAKDPCVAVPRSELMASLGWSTVLARPTSNGEGCQLRPSRKSVDSVLVVVRDDDEARWREEVEVVGSERGFAPLDGLGAPAFLHRSSSPDRVDVQVHLDRRRVQVVVTVSPIDRAEAAARAIASAEVQRVRR